MDLPNARKIMLYQGSTVFVSVLQKSEEYTKLNPMAQLPTLMIDGLTLTQSVSIVK